MKNLEQKLKAKKVVILSTNTCFHKFLLDLKIYLKLVTTLSTTDNRTQSRQVLITIA